MENIRCQCGALLFQAEAIRAVIKIKCRRCGTMNHLRPMSPSQDRRERPNWRNSCGFIFPEK
ncbi:Com family DNA-binding transcriptional regulator [Rhizobium aquaticum]|uniref:Com family DNA-binding transcriptional regulator n=1 Tax=Rhizobium aquaticum TaxID=1549636 RepID=UPI00339367CD